MRIYCASLAAFALLFTSLEANNFQVNNETSEILVDSKASPPPHTVTSYVRKFECDLHINPETLDVSSIRFAFKLKDLDSENKKRDKKMHSWINSDKFSEIVFKLSEVTNVDGQAVGKGILNMHGKSKAVEIPFTVSKNGETVIFDGTSTYDYEDWGLDIIKLFFIKVRPELKVKFHLEGVLQE